MAIVDIVLQVVKLNEQLSVAEKEIQRLSERRVDSVSINSPSSSLSMEAIDPPFLGEYGVEAYDEDVFYIQENNYIHGIEWMNMNLYM